MEQKEKKIKPVSIILFVATLLISIGLIIVPFVAKVKFFDAEAGLIPALKNVITFSTSSFNGTCKAIAVFAGVWGYLVVACFLIGLLGVIVRKKANMLVGIFSFLIGGLFSFYALLMVLVVGEIKGGSAITSIIAAAVLIILSIASFMFAFTSIKEETFSVAETVAEEEAVQPIETKEELEEDTKEEAAETTPEVKEEEEAAKTEEEIQPEATKEESEAKEEPKKVAKKANKKVASKVATPVEEAPKEEQKEETRPEEPVQEEVKPEEAAPEIKEEIKETKPAKGQTGKYEVFPEAGFYKYRLKANNGEILLVSSSYKTREGAHNGIATLRKNVKDGSKRVVTDKNGFSQFRISTANDGRLVVAGEIYPTLLSAQNALASVEKFYKTHKEIDLDEIPETEVREWKVELPPVNPTSNGKVEIFVDENSKKWQGRLLASNGVLLFTTTTYSSKNAVTKAIENIKTKALAGSILISRDKQNRYQFRVFSDNGAVLVMGETYPSKDSAISAASSVRNFIENAKLIDLSKQN